jgi:hypothetical protein
VRYSLKHRGNREDSTSLPAEAKQDGNIRKYLQSDQLEAISKDAFFALGKRQIDVRPTEFLKRSNVRETGVGQGVPLHADPSDKPTTLTQVKDTDAHKAVREATKLEWAGELMSTEEELETFDYSKPEHNYPSHHRDGDERQY